MQWAWERLYATDTQHVLAQNTLGGETKEQRTESQSTPVSDARAVTPVDTHPPFARTASEPAALSVSAAAVPLLPSYSSSALPSLSASESSSFHLSSELLASLHPSEAASLRERVSQLPPSLRPVVAHGEMQRRASTPDLLSLLPRTPVNPEVSERLSCVLDTSLTCTDAQAHQQACEGEGGSRPTALQGPARLAAAHAQSEPQLYPSQHTHVIALARLHNRACSKRGVRLHRNNLLRRVSHAFAFYSVLMTTATQRVSSLCAGSSSACPGPARLWQ